MTAARSIRDAEAAAVAAIRRDLQALVDTRELTVKKSLPLDRLATLLAHGAFGAMVIPAEYVAGYRDAMAKVRANLDPLLADDFEQAASEGDEQPEVDHG